MLFFFFLGCNNDGFSVESGCVLVFGERGYENGFIFLSVWCAVERLLSSVKHHATSRSPEGFTTPSLSHPRRMKEKPAFLFSFNVHSSAPSSDVCVSHDDFVNRRARSEPERRTSAPLFTASDWKYSSDECPGVSRKQAVLESSHFYFDGVQKISFIRVINH